MPSITKYTAALFLATAAAQYAIDPNSVSNTTRMTWCQNQKTECPLICLQTPNNTATVLSNTCDWQSLTYSCVCSNGLSPNISEYSQTLPYFICQEWGTQCVSNCNGANTCQAACQQNHPCGAQNPTLLNTSTSSGEMASTMGGGSGSAGGHAQTTDRGEATLYSGFAGATTAASNGGNGGTGTAKSGGSRAVARVWALSVGQTFGSMALIGVVFGGIAVLL